jgi:hypothetical protein
MPHYQTLRSVSDNHVFVVCLEGKYVSLPDHVRRLGPWQMLRRDIVENLKTGYRLALVRHGYVLERSELAVFKPEV